MGRQWLNAFEQGEKSSAPLDMVMRVVDALDVSVTLSKPAAPPPVDEEEPVDLDVLLDEMDA